MESSIVDIILDELVRAAIDGGGVETRRCETIANIISTITSIGVRGRLYSRLRKVYHRLSANPNESDKYHLFLGLE